MLVQHLDRHGNIELLLLDRGYPSRQLVALLDDKQISFCMWGDQSGFRAVRGFWRSSHQEQVVTLRIGSLGRRRL